MLFHLLRLATHFFIFLPVFSQAFIIINVIYVATKRQWFSLVTIVDSHKLLRHVRQQRGSTSCFSSSVAQAHKRLGEGLTGSSDEAYCSF